MAEAALHDLADNPRVTKIFAIDLNVDRSRAVLARIKQRGKIAVVRGDFTKVKLPHVDVVLNCAWYELNLKAMDLALKLKAHYVDLGGLYHMTKKQLKRDAEFRRAHRLAVLGCGSTPGITNVMAARMAHNFETIDTVAILDASHDPALSDETFLPPFSIRTMLAEYLQPAPVLRRGRMAEVAAHSEPENHDFGDPIGSVTAGTVIHSETATLPEYLKDKGIKNIAFKIVYPPSVKRQLALLVGMGLHNGEGISFLTKLSQKNAQFQTPKDFEILRVRMVGTRQGRPLSKTWDCEIRPSGVLSAGAIGVGFAAAIGASMAALGQGKIRSGAAAPESALDEDVFFRELRRRKSFSLIETLSHPVAL
jgi:saccharopine dehydrogenase (NAD+, L-lysine-forming)